MIQYMQCTQNNQTNRNLICERRYYMYRILMIDDEPAVLNGLEKAMPWQEYGFEEIVLATSGEEALKIMQEKAFDIMISDIRMSHMSGLELLKKVREAYPSVSCIILTAYSEFDYVLEALRLGVDNFLLKPINPQELTSTIQHSLERLDKNATPVIENDDTNFRQNVIYRWLTGDLVDYELDNRAKLCNINMFCRNYNIVMLKPFSDSSMSEETINIIREKLSEKLDCYEYISDNKSVFFIVGGRLITSEILADIMSNNRRFVKNAYIIIGQPVADSKRISTCYFDLNELSVYARLFSERLLIVEELKNKIKEKSSPDISQVIQEILHSENRQAIINNISRYISTRGSENADTESLLLEMIAFLNCLFKYLSKSNFTNEQLASFKEKAINTLNLLSKKNKLEDDLVNIISEAQKLILNEFENTSPIIRRVIVNLKSRLNQPVSIKKIAQQFSVNPSYLGYLFKEETGLFFSE